MASAARDSNNVPTLLGALSTDGITPTRVKASAINHGLEVDDATTGTDHGVIAAPRDSNNSPVLLAVSATTATVGGIDYIEGVTPVVVYADSSGNLLVDSM